MTRPASLGSSTDETKKDALYVNYLAMGEYPLVEVHYGSSEDTIRATSGRGDDILYVKFLEKAKYALEEFLVHN